MDAIFMTICKILLCIAIFLCGGGGFSFSPSENFSDDSLVQQDYSQISHKVQKKEHKDPDLLYVFCKAYPFVKFSCEWDEGLLDWAIDIAVTNPSGGGETLRHGTLYWCNTKFLPREKLAQKEKYRPMLYYYPAMTPDPAKFSEADKARILRVTSDKARSEGAIDPPFLYDIIYDTASRQSIESHIKKLSIFSHSVSVHEYLEDKISLVNSRVEKLSKVNGQVAQFFGELSKTYGFNYRNVRDTSSRSFHSTGLAIDILPVGSNKKTIYWLWRRELVGNNWFMTPLDIRWSPPPQIISIFESCGFVWGGKWVVWDNMHFEYHPELLIYNGLID